MKITKNIFGPANRVAGRRVDRAYIEWLNHDSPPARFDEMNHWAVIIKRNKNGTLGLCGPNASGLRKWMVIPPNKPRKGRLCYCGNKLKGAAKSFCSKACWYAFDSEYKTPFSKFDDETKHWAEHPEAQRWERRRSEIKNAITKDCKQCGKSFPASRASGKYKGDFCSCKCANKFTAPGKTTSHPLVLTESEKREIEILYANGLFPKQIAKIVHSQFGRGSSRTIKRHLIESGKYDNNRVLPQYRKGFRLDSTKPETHLAAQFRSEQSYVRRWDEEHHWGNHPSLSTWRARKQYRKHYALKTNYFIASKLRNRIYCVLKGLKKSAPTLDLLGCSLDFFRHYIESRFKKGMSWDNYGSLWHLDHIEPCDSFDLSQADQQRRCFHFSNLRPLNAKENRMKHARLSPTQRQFLLAH